ncbi:MAG: aspartate/glutamate racemase family protein [Sulfitobacter sp.]
MPQHPRTAPFLGILMLDTAFPRVIGDAGNPASYPFPAKIKIVTGAGALDIVTPGQPDRTLLQGFIAAAQELEQEGAVGLVSTCGFLIHFQEQLAQAVNIPVMVSALSLYPMLRTAIGSAPIGILTASTESLTNGALECANIADQDVVIAGFETCTAFSQTILAAKPTTDADFDPKEICKFAVAQATHLLKQNPNIGGYLLECGNLPPYAAAIRAATGKPVVSILDAAQLIWSASN